MATNSFLTLNANISTLSNTVQLQTNIDGFEDSSFNMHQNTLDILQRNVNKFHDITKIVNFIDNKNNSVEKEDNNDIDFLFSIENNDSFVLQESHYDNLIELSLQMEDQLFNFSRIANRSVLNNKKISKDIKSYLIKKADIADQLLQDLDEAIKEKKENISKNSIENNLKRFLFERKYTNRYVNNSSFLNKNVSNFSDINKKFNSNKIKKKKDVSNRLFTLIDGSFIDDHFNLEDFSKITQIGFSVFEENNFKRQLKETESDLFVQLMINSARSLYTLSVNSMFDYYDTDRISIVNFDSQDLRNIVSEFEGDDSFKIFDYINAENQSVNIEEISRKKYLIDNQRNYSISQSIDLNDTSFTSLPGHFYISRSNRSFILSEIINKNKEKFSYSLSDKSTDLSLLNTNSYFNSSNVQIQLTGSAEDVLHGSNPITETPSVPEAYKRSGPEAIFQISKYFSSNFYNINLNSLGSINDKNIILAEIKSFLVGGGTNKISSDSTIRFVNTLSQHRNSPVIYFQKRPVVSYTKRFIFNADNTVNNESAVLGFSKSTNFLQNDNLIELNANKEKLRVDNFVKSVKRKIIENQEIDLKIFNQIIKNISNSGNKEVMLSYCIDDLENISIASKEDDLFKLMFSLEAEKAYSHIDLVGKKKISNKIFSSLDDLKKEGVVLNEQFFNNKVKEIKDIFSLYYPETIFLSSSTFYASIINSILKEANIVENSKNYEDLSTTQALYFNFIKENLGKNESIDNVIATRFLTKAIQKDIVSAKSIYNKNTSKKYLYDYKKFNIEDYDTSSKADVKRYLDDIFNTSKDLNNIRQNIFSKENILSLQEKSSYSFVNNLSINRVPELQNFDAESWQNSDNFYVNANINMNIFPYKSMFYTFLCNKNFSDASTLKFDVSYRSKIKSSGEEENITYQLDDLILENTKSDIVRVKVVPSLNDEVNRRRYYQYPYFVIEDKFDKACESDNFYFNSVLKIIQIYLRHVIKDYEKNNFKDFSDIEKFISENSFVRNEIVELLSIMSNYYLSFFERIQRESCFKIYDWHKKNVSKSLLVESSNSNIPVNGLISSFSNLYDNTSQAFNLSVNDNISVLDFNLSKKSINDFERIIDEFNNQKISFYKTTFENENLAIENKWFTEFSLKCIEVLKSLTFSDLSQSITFDIINEILSATKENIKKSREDLSSSNNFINLRQKINQVVISEIEDRFHDEFYINKLSKFACEMNLLSKNYKDKIEDNFSQEVDESFSNYDLLRDINLFNKSIISNARDKIENTIDDANNAGYYPVTNHFINSNIYSFGLNKNSVYKLKKDGLVKITVDIIDLNNVSNFYIPKVYVFSPYLTSSLYYNSFFNSHFNSQLERNNFLFYDKNKSIKERLRLVNESQINIYLQKVLESKFSNFSNSEISILKNHILNCHSLSSAVDNNASMLHNIKTSNDVMTKNKFDAELVQIINQLSDEEFQVIFGVAKTNLLDALTYDSLKECYTLKRQHVKKDLMIILDYLNRMQQICDLNYIEKSFNEDYYDVYNLPISIKNFKFIGQTNREVIRFNRETEPEFQSEEVDILELEKLILKISDFNGDYVKNNYNKFLCNTKKINNYKVIVKGEII